MTSPLSSLEPALLWQHFDAIRRIPRPSRHEERIAAHVREWAAGRGFEVLSDAAGSLVIRVPASPGRESRPTVVLQGHLDMVCEKNSDVALDFMTQGIEVEVKGDWVQAKGTTLGADNGIGLAAAMAAADDPSIEHGPLEILCTVDEETGLTGAQQLDPAIVRGTILLNLDTEEDGAFYIGCAGGGDTHAELALARRRGMLGSVPVRLSVRGLRGGHSGLNIIENRGNAIKLAVRALLAALRGGLDVELVSIDGGSKHNAIPRECFAVCRVLKSELEAFRAAVARATDGFRDEFLASDPDLSVAVEPLDDADEHVVVLNAHGRDRLLHLLDALPHGVLSMSRDVAGLVETSNNLAVVATEADRARVVVSYRSSVMPALYAVAGQVRSACAQAGATFVERDAYPSWKPNPSSPILRRAIEVWRGLYGSEPAVKAIHAGLECGLLLDKVAGMDAVSMGPQIENAHSPEERVQISSVQRFYRHLGALLAAI